MSPHAAVRVAVSGWREPRQSAAAVLGRCLTERLGKPAARYLGCAPSESARRTLAPGDGGYGARPPGSARLIAQETESKLREVRLGRLTSAIFLVCCARSRGPAARTSIGVRGSGGCRARICARCRARGSRPRAARKRTGKVRESAAETRANESTAALTAGAKALTVRGLRCDFPFNAG